MNNERAERSFLGTLKRLSKMQCFTATIVILVLTIFLSIVSKVFLTWPNIRNILIAASVMGVLGCGSTTAMLMGAMDISQYSATALIGMCAARLLHNGVGTVPVILFCVAAGIVVGVLNGISVTVLKIVPLIATVGMQYVTRGLAYIMGSGAYITFTNDFFSGLGKGSVLGLPNVVWIMFLCIVVFEFILRKTTFGRKLYAVGGNQKAAYLAGIQPKSIMRRAFILTGITDGLAAILVISMFSSCNPQYGSGADFDIIVSIVLGGISLSGGKGKLSGTFLGIIIMCIISNMFSLLSVSSYAQMIARGIILIGSVALDAARGRGYMD